MAVVAILFLAVVAAGSSEAGAKQARIALLVRPGQVRR